MKTDTTLKPFKIHEFFFTCNFMLEKKRNLPFLKNNPFCFRFYTVNFFFKLLTRFVNVLKINGFLRSLTDTSVNFRKPPFVNGTLPSPKFLTGYICFIKRSGLTLHLCSKIITDDHLYYELLGTRETRSCKKYEYILNLQK